MVHLDNKVYQGPQDQLVLKDLQVWQVHRDHKELVDRKVKQDSLVHQAAQDLPEHWGLLEQQDHKDQRGLRVLLVKVGPQVQ